MTPYYADDSVTIYHGDAYDFLPLPGDVLLTDPPYGVDYRTNRQDGAWASRWKGVGIAGDDGTTTRDAVLASWAPRPALVFGTWKASMPEGVREVLVWDKVVSTGTGDLSLPWRPSWEAIFVIGQGFAGRRGHGVLRYSLPTLAPDRRWHPTPKPVPLLRDLLAKCPDGVVVDPFMGAGSTLEAAKSLGRKAIGIEIDEAYCERAANRCRQEVLGLVG